MAVVQGPWDKPPANHAEMMALLQLILTNLRNIESRLAAADEAHRAQWELLCDLINDSHYIESDILELREQR